MRKITNRWQVAVAGVLAQLCLGSVYAWSVFKKPIMQAHGWHATEVGLTFTLMMFFMGPAAAIGGYFVDKSGAKKIATIGAWLFGGGLILAGVADALSCKWLYWLGYGVIGGIGNGMAYVTPIAVLVRWFPDKRGFITGLGVMGFGFGASIMGQVAPVLIPLAGISYTFYLFGSVLLVVLLYAAQFFVNPPEDWRPPQLLRADNKPAKQVESVDLRQALGTYQYYLLWAVDCINLIAGIALISNLSPLAQGQIGVTPQIAGTIIFITAIFNGFGRIVWSSISDQIGRKNTFLLILGTQIPAYYFLATSHNLYLFTLLACYIFLCYGGCCGTMPAFVTDTFGPKNIGKIYGTVLFACSVAAVIGQMLMEYSKSISDGFGLALIIATCLLAVGFILTLLYQKPLFLRAKP